MKIKYLITCCAFLIVFISQGYGQTDSLMHVAKELIKQDKYPEAEKIYNDLLSRNDNNDVRFALGLMYSWSKQYDKARATFLIVLKARPTSKEVYIAALNNELWADKYSLVLDLAVKSKSIFPDDADILIREAKALNYLHRSDDAVSELKSYLKKDNSNTDVRDLLESIQTDNMLNSIGISYTYDFFSNNESPWQLAYLQYKRKTEFGSVIGRFNYASRFGSTGYQMEVDAYPKLSSKSYAYVNVGYSPGTLFPVFRLGMDYNRSLPNAFEASAGFRYLDFKTSNVVIYTGHIAKYIGNYWIAFRPYIVPDSGKVSISGLLTVRRYFASANDYIGLQFGYGTSPDDRYRMLTGQNLRLAGYNTRISYNHIFNKRWIFNVSGAYANEEYITSQYRSDITFDVGFNYLF